MATPIALDVAIEAILDAIVAAIDAQRPLGGKLEEVKAVVRGDRARPLPEFPAVWVVPEMATSDDTTLGHAEAWVMPVRIAAMVNSADPEQAGRDCVRIAARARAAALTVRRLGLAYVNDITTTAFDASVRRSSTNRNLHWADATVRVRFRTYEEGS